MPPATRNRIADAAAFLLLLSYFLYCARPALFAHFAADDMMNIAHYWARGWWRTLADCLTFWSSQYRPAGGLYYLSLYRVFKLNPLPYHAVALAFLFGGTWLSYLVSRLLARSFAVAVAAAVLFCAQANMVDLFYGTDTIYDILASFFSLLTLLLYVRARTGGGYSQYPAGRRDSGLLRRRARFKGNCSSSGGRGAQL
jgi:uncharacterized membrane protein